MNHPIRVAIADDHGLLRQGIMSLLEKMEDVIVIGDMSSGEEAVNFAQAHEPDVFLLDIMMHGMNGIEATRWIKEQTPAVKIILISSEVNKDFISAGIKSGISGYLNKDVDQKTLFTAIKAVMNGERFFSPEITALVFEDFYLKEKDGKGLPGKKAADLTKREVEVLVLIAYGKTLKEIAEELFLSIKTVETHKLHIQEKLGLSNTAKLVRYAIENNFIELSKPK
jgi:DNA-binding NarL/FixJ family response regulator